MQRKQLLIAALLIAAAFLIGYIPNEIATRQLATRMREAELDLALANLHRRLAVAAMHAQRNNFGLAEETAVQFFEGCRRTAGEFSFRDRPRTRVALTGYASSGDRILGDLANGDPAAKEELASMFLTMDGVLQRRQ
jgi:hypothetical protein